MGVCYYPSSQLLLLTGDSWAWWSYGLFPLTVNSDNWEGHETYGELRAWDQVPRMESEGKQHTVCTGIQGHWSLLTADNKELEQK